MLREAQGIDASPISFDVMVDDIEAWRDICVAAKWIVSEIDRGQIHDHFEVETPDNRALTINSSHAGDRAV